MAKLPSNEKTAIRECLKTTVRSDSDVFYCSLKKLGIESRYYSQGIPDDQYRRLHGAIFKARRTKLAKTPGNTPHTKAERKSRSRVHQFRR